MEKVIIQLMECTSCRHGELREEKNSLVCENCQEAFPFEGGVPITMPAKEAWAKKANQDRLTYNKFYEERIKSHNGWWEKPNDPYLALRHDHNLDTSRWFVCDLIKKNGAGEFVLDAGGGEGYVQQHLLSLYKQGKPQAICVDLSDALLADGKSRHNEVNMHYIAGDIQHIALKDNSVDTALSIETLEHVRELPSYAREMVRVLKPGGRLYITTPNKQGVALWFNDRGLYFAYNLALRVKNLFSKQKTPINPVEPYGHYEGEDGYECYLTSGELKKYIQEAGLQFEKAYFTQWGGEAFFLIGKTLHIPIGLMRFITKSTELLEKALRGTYLARYFGFTQIGIYRKPNA